MSTGRLLFLGRGMAITALVMWAGCSRDNTCEGSACASTNAPQPAATAGVGLSGAGGAGQPAAVSGAGAPGAGSGGVAGAAVGGSAAGMVGSAGDVSLPAAGASGTGPTTAPLDAGVSGDSDDAGSQPDASSTAPTAPTGDGINVVAESMFGPVELSVDMTPCANARCAVDAAKASGFSTELALMNSGFDMMPVLAGWEGCGDITWSLRAVWSGLNYTAIYTTPFANLTPPATCRASIVQGSWLTFAGNLDLKVTAGAAFCTEQATSPESLNQLCFAPPGTKLEVSSGLARWSCVIATDPMSFTMEEKPEPLVITSVAQQLVSCVAERD